MTLSAPSGALPAATRRGLAAYLAGGPDWTQDGTWRGCQAWRHTRGTRVLVPAAGRYSDDGEILAAHHPAAASPHRCHCGLPHPCPAFRAATGLPPGKPRPLGTRTHPR